MGNRLNKYGFTSPFRAHVKGSNYDASLADLSGGAINQFLTDVSTYNTIIRDYGLTSQIEYKQPNGSWGTAAPSKPTQRVMYQPGSSPSGTTYSAERYTLDNNPNAKGEQINLMPEYRWRISGDIEGANQALRDAGLQGSYTQPDGRTINTGGSFTAIVPGKSVTLTTPLSGYGGVQRAGTAYVDSADPLGAGIGGSHSAIDRAYNGATAPQYYTLPNRPFGTGTTIDAMSDQSYGTYYVKRVADEVFSNPNIEGFGYNPTGFRAALEAAPQIKDQIGTYFNDTADFWNKRDNDGGGPLGVIAKGLAGVAQFATMAAGLNAGVNFLGSLVGGSTLAGAAGAARAGFNAIPSLGGGIAQLAGNPSLSNAISAGLGAIQGAGQGGLPGAALGAISGYAPGLAGSAIGQIGRASGIGVPQPPPQPPGPFQMMNVPPVNNGAVPRFASSGSITQNPTVAWNFRGTDYVEPASSAGTVASALAAQPPSGISPQSAAVAPTVPMGAQTPLLSSTGLLSLPANFQQLISASPRGGLLTGGGTRPPVMFGGAPVNQQSMMANLPQILANIRSRAGGAPPAAA